MVVGPAPTQQVIDGMNPPILRDGLENADLFPMSGPQQKKKERERGGVPVSSKELATAIWDHHA